MRAATILALASMAFLSTPITALPNQSPSDPNLLSRQVTESPCGVLAEVDSSLSQAETAINTFSLLPVTPTERQLSRAVTNLITSALRDTQSVQRGLEC